MGAQPAEQLTDIRKKIREIADRPPTLDWKKSREKLVATMSTIESIFIVLTNQIENELDEKAKTMLKDLMYGHELPILMGTWALESQMLWTHTQELENRWEKHI